MTMLGMDVAGMTTVASQLDGQANAINAAMSGVDRLVEETLAEWFGPDAQRFVSDWYAQHRPAMTNAYAAIAAMVSAARRNIDEQQVASGASPGGASPGGVSPGGLTPDGRVDVREQSVSTAAGPTDVHGLLALVPGAYAQPGGVSVTFSGTGADRRAIVTVSGTEQWNFGGTNPDDMSTNIGNAFGAHNDKEEAIRQAMLDAGVQPTDQVLLVGHSQGGADAINFASDPTNRSQFDIRGVLTAGAPETVEYPPSSIPVLELRTDGDLVPTLGAASAAGFGAAGLPGAVIGSAVHDATVPDNVKIVELPGGYSLPWNAHPIANYLADSQHISDPAVANFTTATSGFLTGAPATTYTYSAQRVGDGWRRYE